MKMAEQLLQKIRRIPGKQNGMVRDEVFDLLVNVNHRLRDVEDQLSALAGEDAGDSPGDHLVSPPGEGEEASPVHRDPSPEDAVPTNAAGAGEPVYDGWPLDLGHKLRSRGIED